MLGIFYPKDNEEHFNTLKAFAIGMKQIEDDVFWGPFETYNGKDFDTIVVFGIGKKFVPASYMRGGIIQAQRQCRKDVIVLEKGYIKRNEYYAVGLNGLNGRAQFNNNNSPPDRWNKLDVDLNPWRTHGEHILLIGQVPWDASVQHTDHIEWLTKTVAQIKEITDRPIIFRPHPLAATQTPSLLGTSRSVNTLETDLINAHAVVTFSSNTGVDAILQGIPSYAADQGSMIWNIANKDITHINAPALKTREQWVNDIAYTQWNYDEMRSGEAWMHIKPLLIKQEIA